MNFPLKALVQGETIALFQLNFRGTGTSIRTDVFNAGTPLRRVTWKSLISGKYRNTAIRRAMPACCGWKLPAVLIAFACVAVAERHLVLLS